MPTYQYACTDCNEQLEVHQSFTDDALTDCPSCAGRLRKVFNAVGVVFKGSGFYKTDSRANGSEPSAGTSSTQNGSSADSSGGSSSPDSSAGPSSDSSSGSSTSAANGKTKAAEKSGASSAA